MFAVVKVMSWLESGKEMGVRIVLKERAAVGSGSAAVGK